MKTKFYFLAVAMIIALASQAQTSNNATFINESKGEVLLYSPQGGTGSHFIKYLEIGGLYLKIEEGKKLKVIIKSEDYVVGGTAKNFFLQDNKLSLEGDSQPDGSGFTLVVKLSITDQKAFEEFQKKVPVKSFVDADFDAWYKKWQEKEKQKRGTVKLY